MYRDKDTLERLYLVEKLTMKQIGAMYNVGYKTIEYYITKNGLHRGQKHKFDESKIDETNPIYMYYLGYIATDGSVDRNNKRVPLSNVGEDFRVVAENLRNYFSAECPLYKSKKVFKNGHLYTLMLTSEKLVDDVERLNCGGTSFTVGVPTSFYTKECATRIKFSIFFKCFRRLCFLSLSKILVGF